MEWCFIQADLAAEKISSVCRTFSLAPIIFCWGCKSLLSLFELNTHSWAQVTRDCLPQWNGLPLKKTHNFKGTAHLHTPICEGYYLYMIYIWCFGMTCVHHNSIQLEYG